MLSLSSNFVPNCIVICFDNEKPGRDKDFVFLAAGVEVTLAALLDFEGRKYHKDLLLFVGAITLTNEKIQKQQDNKQQGS
jgi:hypothetical protein